jgi:vitamin B12 transporter
MRMSRLWRQALACRTLLTFLVLNPLSVSSALAEDPAAGLVVDRSGQGLPRALVRLVDAQGIEASATFSDETGRFRITSTAEGCHIIVSLTGFTTSTVPCSERPLRIVLDVAPVEETVIVTATRTEVTADQTGASVTTFTAEELAERRAPTLADLLRASPGAMVVRSGGIGAVTSLFVRGGESDYNKVLLDGIPLNEPGGTFDFSNLTTDNLERVEIVRGAQSALFGSDAMSSVVQLFTKHPERTAHPRVEASLEGGTYNTVRGGASVSGASQHLDYAVGVSRFDSDNRDPNSGVKNTTLSANVGIGISDTATIRFIGRGQLEHVGTPGQTAFERPDLDAFFQRHDGVGGISFDQQVTPAFRQRAQYSLTVSHQVSTDLGQDPPYTPRYGDHVAPFVFSDFPFDTFDNLHRHHASYQADLRLASDGNRGNQLLTLLVDWDGERATLDDRLAGSETVASRNNVGIAVQHQAQWRRFVATGGARFEHNASFGQAVVPRGAIVVVAHEGAGTVGDTRIRGAAGLGIKEPTVLQSFSMSPFFHGNPNLEPERSRSVEAGIEQRLAADRLRAEITWFDNRYENLISTRTTDPATFAAEYFNIGLTRARGSEVAVNAAPLPNLRLNAGYTFLASKIVDSTSPDNVVFQPGKWLFRRPRHSGFVGANWTYERLGFNLTGLFIGRFVDSDFASLQPPLVENPGYTVWEARLHYKLTEQVSALLAADNLTDRDYMEALGYRALGRAVRAGLRVGF